LYLTLSDYHGEPDGFIRNARDGAVYLKQHRLVADMPPAFFRWAAEANTPGNRNACKDPIRRGCWTYMSEAEEL